MNKFVSALMSAVLCLGIAGCSAGGASTTAAGTGAAVTAAGTTATGSGVAGTAFQAGTYEAEEKGHNGPIKVKVTVTDSAIEAIEADASLETKGLGDAAVEKIKGQILESQGLGVDLVTGAT
ncbi:MAG: FMN-binding protein, partial [Clostridiaceae bacterium]